jgi:hypothetical protein
VNAPHREQQVRIGVRRRLRDPGDHARRCRARQSEHAAVDDRAQRPQDGEAERDPHLVAQLGQRRSGPGPLGRRRADDQVHQQRVRRADPQRGEDEPPCGQRAPGPAHRDQREHREPGHHDRHAGEHHRAVLQPAAQQRATVRSYLASATTKLGARHRVDGIRIATEMGWI